MATNDITNQPLIVIVGPTASGKSALAMDIALRFNGEIICADSRTVYTGMDIATAKPTVDDQQRVPHWGLDLVRPDQRFSAADFKKYADQKIGEIRQRGHIPLLVGGTGLYIDAVVFGYEFGNDIDIKMRSELQHKSLEELHDYCTRHAINLPENAKNKRYVIRAIENAGIPPRQNIEPVYENIIVGITTDKIILRERIEERIEQQLKNGVVEEAIILGEKYGWEIQSMTSNIYSIVREYTQHRITIDELKAHAAVADWRLAKRQLTWLRRNEFIHWDRSDSLNTYLIDRLVTAE